MYAVYHGPEGLRGIARRVNDLAERFRAGARGGGLSPREGLIFDTVALHVPGAAQKFADTACTAGINVRIVDADTVSVTLDETTTEDQARALAEAWGFELVDVAEGERLGELTREDELLPYPVFHQYRSETSLMRYMRSLADKDLALDRTMIPLGSCTMKLNAAAEMAPITWPEFADAHPFAPAEQVRPYVEIITELEEWLAGITGYDEVSVQPNAGSQGEFAGLMAIRAYHRANGDAQRTVCLIPSSAHGTNAASAVMAGMQVVVVACDESGDVDLTDLESKITEHRENLAALMITYPSTHGVFEEAVGEICARVYEAGGQVYVDGANLNALVGLAKPGAFGADVSHLNLHKTFAIPHGGGGPGVGPMGCERTSHHSFPAILCDRTQDRLVGDIRTGEWGRSAVRRGERRHSSDPVDVHPHDGRGEGLREATSVAILSANYIAHRLAEHYPILYTAANGTVAHECIVDIRPVTAASGISVDDIAKRLMDYGFHAPTMSFPVAGTP